MTRRTAAKKNQPQPPLKSILKPSAAENTIENEKNEEETLTDATDADLTDTVITKSLLKELFEKNYKKIVNEFNKTIESLKSQLDEVEARATNAEKKIKLLETENQKLKEVLNSTSNTANANANAINALEERIEDRTNRQLRKTMVFRGVPEKDNETWDDTKSLLAGQRLQKYSTLRKLMQRKCRNVCTKQRKCWNECTVQHQTPITKAQLLVQSSRRSTTGRTQ